MKVLVSSFLLLTALLHSCDPNNISIDAPACVKDLIQKDPHPKEVWRYTYQDETVFLVVPDCCDQYISVYSSQCVLICSPSGGLTGKGDEKCPDFYSTVSGGILVWSSNK